MAANDVSQAAKLYRQLLDLASDPVLTRATQIAIANQYMAEEQYEAARTAYEIFVRKFPHDHEVSHIKLLLALINTRYLNDPVRAAELLDEVREKVSDTAHRELIETLDEELGQSD